MPKGSEDRDFLMRAVLDWRAEHRSDREHMLTSAVFIEMGDVPLEEIEEYLEKCISDLSSFRSFLNARIATR